MKNIFIHLLVLLLVGYASSILMDKESFPFKDDNKCAACIVGGNTFCVKQYDNYTIPEGELGPETRCCEYDSDDCTDDVFLDPEWYCSDKYFSSAYALTALCPKTPDKCSGKSLYQLNRVNSVTNVVATAMIKGEHCTYEIEGNCGAPSF